MKRAHFEYAVPRPTGADRGSRHRDGRLAGYGWFTRHGRLALHLPANGFSRQAWLPNDRQACPGGCGDGLCRAGWADAAHPAAGDESLRCENSLKITEDDYGYD